MNIRRVVTGQQLDGTSVVVSDGPVEPIEVALIPGSAFHSVWGADDAVCLPSEGQRPPAHGWFPPPTGHRFCFLTVAPDSVTRSDDLDFAGAFAELDNKLPGLRDVLEPGNPGMHTTDTVDLGIVLRGEVILELDDGHEVRLSAGDVFVQNGTRHAWRNRTDQPCTLAITLIGARRHPRPAAP
ncbi:MAG TPA: cupin domain-containing protein [Acidimicrobiia bacterium]|nr:cupin domain-containing protein [Acidimicrobiia bacterium]